MEIGWVADGPELYTLWTAYANSKLCNMLMTLELVRQEALEMKEGQVRSAVLYCTVLEMTALHLLHRVQTCPTSFYILSFPISPLLSSHFSLA